MPRSSESSRELGWQRWNALAQKPGYESIAEWIGSQSDNAALESFFNYSPYLTTLALTHPDVVHAVATQGAEACFADILRHIVPLEHTDNKFIQLKHQLRMAKRKVALLTAIADITEEWPLEKVTLALSEFAEKALQHSVEHILLNASRRGEIELADTAHSAAGSGIIILGMGKLGGHELNYSSDIDLIIFFRKNRLNYKGRQTEQHFMNRLAQDLVNIMQDRTAEGYVFRTDLRLRPDPASTPPAITTEAAFIYYESVGQNWERAAMIKARPIAGDMEAGRVFLERLAPFMWRRSLDFASINDIQSIKRQMDSRKNASIHMRGHNVKIGVGGIREIEFYVHIFQLIWGGREKSLRTKATCATLKVLHELGLIDEDIHQVMVQAYVFLRTLEHRLQMVNDNQTHTVPTDDEALGQIAGFMGYASVDELEGQFLHHTRAVHDIYALSFKGADKLSTDGNLVFTGVSHDPETIQTLSRMGFSQPETVSEVVMGWHHGSCRATRTKQARELLTELMPTLLSRLAETANPDAALLRFHDFLRNLPAGVQLFSLFNINPQLLELIANILGSAPSLSEQLSRTPALLDIVLYDDFYEDLPDKELLFEQMGELVSLANDYEERMDRVRQFRNEKQFQAGVQFMKHMINAAQAGQFLSDLAEVTIQYTCQVTMREFEERSGKVESSRFGVLALGKLGSREMTFSSDIDLIFVYDAADEDMLSDGDKELSASVYYNRFAQRLLTAITGMARHGRLYEVDTRLRPSGGKGLLAVSVTALQAYFKDSAWTFEYMALTKARPIIGDDAMRLELTGFVRKQLTKKRDPARLKKHVQDMRSRIDKEYGSQNPWDIKYVRGGLVDLDFIAQYLLLLNAPNSAPPFPGSTSGIIKWLMDMHYLDELRGNQLLEAEQFVSHIFQTLRLCYTERFDEETAPQGLKKQMVEQLRQPDFESLKQHLLAVEKQVHAHYIDIIES
ncbi:MAG: bifunctional [glutamine synthetase] adenylyltransferase/[glutamine synthetase]-adenylyl-L-tyrosine phosphorylase [Alphaproteobacteria bacterium]